jgi:leader peptidase (prepilin peptidase)/N-methyltransferase
MTSEIPPQAVAPIAFVFGLLIGSFLNVVIHRLPMGLSIVHPPSRCPGCEAPIAPWDNVPVLSYLWLRGRCRHCGTRISARYPAVELATGLLFAAVAWRFGATGWTLLHCAFVAALVAAAMIDLDHQIIPDSISLGGLAAALVVVPALHALDGAAWGEALVQSLLGAAVGAGVLWGVAFLHARLCVALGREFDHWPGEGQSPPRPSEADYWLWFPGLGLGDVKLLGFIGAVLGVVGVLDTILAASAIGLVLGGAQAIARGALGEPFGFGPAIAMGAVATLFLPPLWITTLLA